MVVCAIIDMHSIIRNTWMNNDFISFFSTLFVFSVCVFFFQIIHSSPTTVPNEPHRYLFFALKPILIHTHILTHLTFILCVYFFLSFVSIHHFIIVSYEWFFLFYFQTFLKNYFAQFCYWANFR